MKPTPRPKSQKPILELQSPLKVKVYRATFRAFESTRFLDAAALKATTKATIECGTLEAGGLSQIIAAEIRRGKIVALLPVGCKGCAPRKGGKVGSAVLKKTVRLVAQKLRDAGIETPSMPIPVVISRRLGLQIPFGPIIIVIGDPGDGGFDFCIQIWIGNKFCWWCLLSPSGCIEFGPPE
ncbi:MAG: hypothetical protein Q7U75_10265 [Desulfobacterales bacterium]|nr:hypothetical protein [Desulfobacterales bacterium]